MDNAKKSTKDARSQLADKGLPGSIAVQDDAAGFPEDVWSKVAAAQAEGGDWALRRKLGEVDSGSARAGVKIILAPPCVFCIHDHE